MIFQQGRYSEAERLARWAIEMLLAADPGNRSTLLANIQLQLGAALMAQDMTGEAMAVYETIAVELSDDAEVLQRVRGQNLDYAIALHAASRFPEALAVAEAARRDATLLFGERHSSTLFARAIGAMARAGEGDRVRALGELDTVVPALQADPLWLSMHRGEMRRILDSYLELLESLIATPNVGGELQGAISKAFTAAEKARDQVLGGLISATARAALPEEALVDLTRQEQDAALHIVALERVLGDAQLRRENQRDNASLDRIRGQLAALRAAADVLRGEIYRRFPDYQRLVDPPPVTIGATQAILGADEALISIHVGPRSTLVWAIRREGRVVFAVVPIKASALATMVKKLRGSLDPQVRHLGDIPEFDAETAHRLYATLLEPVSDGWRDARNILIVPDGPLAQLPLGVLVTKPVDLKPEHPGEPLFEQYRHIPWFMREAALTQLPSVSSIIALRSHVHADRIRKAFAGFGDPWFSAAQAAEARAGQDATQIFAGSDAQASATRGASLSLAHSPKHGESSQRWTSSIASPARDRRRGAWHRKGTWCRP